MAHNEFSFDRMRQSIRDWFCTQAEATEAPTFAPAPTSRPGILHMDIAPGAVVINGIALPQTVIDQLRLLGLPLSWYNAGELRDAVDACAIDCTLIDDDEGIGFEDKLHLSDDERAARAARAADGLRITELAAFGVVRDTQEALSDKLASMREFAQSFGYGTALPCAP